MKRTRGIPPQVPSDYSSIGSNGRRGIDIDSSSNRLELIDGVDMRGRCHGSSVAMEALGLVCGSGFARVENNLSLVCLFYCTAVRESLSWRLIIQEETPAGLTSLLHPSATAAKENLGSRIPPPLTVHHIR